MEVRFTKMEGCGNDYVYISGFDFPLDPAQKPELVKRLSDRHFGIGGDGVIFINPSQIADFEMEMWNADGTRGEMCGNGIRCVGKYVYDYGLTDRTEIYSSQSAFATFLSAQPLVLQVMTSLVHFPLTLNLDKASLFPQEFDVPYTPIGS